ncbi:hypothetical protein L484_001685 [Morus notabilis]|uniref:Uncharacterized protein n=1 Tax=Morus notabilis TaxID=981085 RepID=W9QII8_9ROSA|nr:hypothetical protein L484_001685 [Morus notabilis]
MRERRRISTERERQRREREGRCPSPEAVNLAAPSISSSGFQIALPWAKMRLSGVLAAKKREGVEEVGLREDVEEGGSRSAGIWV